MDESGTDEPRGAVLDITPLSPHEGELDGEEGEGDDASVDDPYVPI